MSEEQVRQLTDMGATVAQARAALAQYKDVQQAAERFFEGAFDHVKDGDGDVPMASASAPPVQKRTIRMATPEDDDEDTPAGDGSGEDEEDDGEDDFIDYDSDDGPAVDAPRTNSDADPYARVFFSKDHREEIIEVEEEPELVFLPGHGEQVKLMTQGEWMKGCPPPSGGEQSFLFALYSQLSDGKCVCPHECGSSVLRKKSDFFPIFPEFASYIAHLRSVVQKTCQRCHSEFCFACGEPVTEKVQRPGAAAPGDPLFHCADIQGVILGVGLSMLEQMFTEQAHESSAAAQDPKARSSSKRRKTGKMFSKDTDDDDDEAYYNLGSSGKRAKGGVGYAGDQKEDNSGQIEAQAAQAAKDAKIGTLLTEIGVYLPSLHREGHHPSDFLPHPTALAHLRRRFNYVSSALLRNDSLADMSDRSVLYFKLLEWLETISAHEALASMMAMPIMTISSVKAVTTRKSANNTPIRERTIIYEGSAGPRELLEAIAIQAHAALKALESTKAPETADEDLTEEQKRMTVDSKGKSKEVSAPIADENQKLLDFCQRIHATANAIDRSLRETKGDAFVERLHASLPKIPTSSSDEGMLVDAGATEESAKKAYMEWATRVRFEYCDLTIPPTAPAPNESDPQLPHYKSYYNNEIRMLALSDIPKRSLAIAKELSILTNNLPIAWDSSIFLRIDETRVDVIKALITGPEGTPYYNGCYLFDIFLGPAYNQSPPSVKYMTTNGGKYRFNPNLYADGKVCLSLLGTWQGPGWVAGRSTLLQVLISIQSMILCEEPYLNEPGWANSAGTAQSRAYSANVRRMVVRTAMLGNLQNPPEPFADIIRTHFRLKAKSISAQLDQWLAQDDGKSTLGDGAGFDGAGARQATGTSSNGLAADVAEMKKMMKELQAGFGTSRRG